MNGQKSAKFNKAAQPIKTHLRNSTGQDRLGDLAIIHIEKELAEKLDLDKVIDSFAILHNRQLQFF